MANASLGAIFAEAWEREWREAPAPEADLLFRKLFEPGYTIPYREYLDLQRQNIYGDVIPRVVTVRRNLRHLGSIRLNPARLR